MVVVVERLRGRCGVDVLGREGMFVFEVQGLFSAPVPCSALHAVSLSLSNHKYQHPIEVRQQTNQHSRIAAEIQLGRSKTLPSAMVVLAHLDPVPVNHAPVSAATPTCLYYPSSSKH